MILFLTFSGFLLAQSSAPTPAEAKPAKLPDATLIQYWHAIAAHHAQMSEFQASLTVKQKQIQENIASVDAQLEGIRKQLAASCGTDSHLDESGADPACVANPKPADKPASK